MQDKYYPINSIFYMNIKIYINIGYRPTYIGVHIHVCEAAETFTEVRDEMQRMAERKTRG